MVNAICLEVCLSLTVCMAEFEPGLVGLIKSLVRECLTKDKCVNKEWKVSVQRLKTSCQCHFLHLLLFRLIDFAVYRCCMWVTRATI